MRFRGRSTSCLLSALYLGCAGDPSPPSGPGRWETAAPVPTPRSEAGIAVAAGMMITVAGFSEVVERYHFAEDRWSTGSSFPSRADHVGAAPLPGGAQILIAGFYATGSNARSEVLVYDPIADGYANQSPLPMAVAAGALIADDRGRIVHLGGSDGASSRAEVWIYDPSADLWSAGPPMQVPRDHLGAALVGGRIYAIGGRNASSFTLDTVEILDLDAQAWSPGPSLQVGRSGHAVATTGGKIYAFGGEGADNASGTFPEVEVLDPEAGVWSFAAPMPTPRHGIQAAVFEGRIHVPMGGTVQGSGMDPAHEVFVP